MAEQTAAPVAWVEYREHAAATAYAAPATPDAPFYVRARTPNDSAQWAAQMRKAHPAHAVRISEPTADNLMQSAPAVLFASYDARGKYRTTARSEITGTHPYVITTYCEGDLVTEFYATVADRDRALWLLERAL